MSRALIHLEQGQLEQAADDYFVVIPAIILVFVISGVGSQKRCW